MNRSEQVILLGLGALALGILFKAAQAQPTQAVCFPDGTIECLECPVTTEPTTL